MLTESRCNTSRGIFPDCGSAAKEHLRVAGGVIRLMLNGLLSSFSRLGSSIFPMNDDCFNVSVETIMEEDEFVPLINVHMSPANKLNGLSVAVPVARGSIMATTEGFDRSAT